MEMVYKNRGLTPPSEALYQFDVSTFPFRKRVSKSPGWGHFHKDVSIVSD